MKIPQGRSPFIRQPLPCGTDASPMSGREPGQMGWYRWVGRLSRGRSVLDVGCGGGAGVDAMNELGAHAFGWDNDPRLKGLNDHIAIGQSLEEFSDGSFDVVTCMDVIEHVIDDQILMGHLFRIARHAVYVTTPNWTRSMARNRHHCREYTIAQFCNTFEPDELWVASPDGEHHRKLLLTLKPAFYEESGINDAHVIGGIPAEYRFNRSVDGLEWPHMCGVFYK